MSDIWAKACGKRSLLRRSGFKGPSLVRLLDALESRGLIERREQEIDRRARGIYLTQAGRRLQQRIARISGNIQERVLGRARADDLEACTRLFDEIERALDQPPLSLRRKDAI